MSEKRTVTVESKNQFSIANLILLALLLAAGAVLRIFSSGFAILGMKPNFMIAMYCLAILLIRPKLGGCAVVGLLAGALYAVVPDAIGGLRFDYLEERYDSTICGSGTLYPAALLWYSALFIASRPVRRLIAGWHASKRGEHHGQHDKKQSGNDLQ